MLILSVRSFKLTLQFIIILLFVNNIYSQTPPFHHYTSKEGLASSNVMNIIQDSKGYIWFATANGISRFDGHKFKSFGINDGINSSLITSIAEDKRGNIFIGNYEKGINVYDGKKIKSLESLNNNLRITNLLYIDDTLFYYWNEDISAFNILTNEQVISSYLYENKRPDVLNLNKIYKAKDNTYLAVCDNGLFRFENNKLIRVSVTGLNDSLFFHISSMNDGTLVIGSKDNIYFVKDNKLTNLVNIKMYDKNIIWRIHCDRNDNIWFGIQNYGFYMIPAGTNKILNIGEKLSSQKLHVNNFYEDIEGNIWVCTYGSGAYCLNNLYISSYGSNDGLGNLSIQSVVTDKYNRIIAGTFDGLYFFNDEKFIRHKVSFDNITEYIYRLYPIENRLYVCTSSARFQPYRKKYLADFEIIAISTPSFCRTRYNDILVGGWSNEIYEVYENDNNLFYYDTTFVINLVHKNNRINEIFEDSKGNIWVGSTMGLSKITKNSKLVFNDEVLNNKIDAIIEDKNNMLWIAGQKGIASFDLKSEQLKSYTRINEYDVSSATSLAVDDKNRIWIGGLNGLFMLDNNNIKHLNSFSGLPTNEVLSLSYDRSRESLLIGTSGGLCILNIKSFDNFNAEPLKVIIKELRSGDSVYREFDNIIFAADVENVQIRYSAPNFSSPGSVIYQYKIGDTWVDNEHDILDFSSLKDGQYNIYIRAKNHHTQWSDPALVSFYIRPWFYRTDWFQVAAFISGMLVIIFIANTRIRRNRRKSTEQIELNRRINDLKHLALSSMMNPHFIFNSLNSVQYLINKNKKEEANDYISMMAKLIRKNLDTARDSYIPMHEELYRLGLYLEIEKLRFENKFTYEFEFGKDVDKYRLLIPNMILQPFVENTVWHGLLKAEGKGKVILSFMYENINMDSEIQKVLVIRITDNGIGLNKAKANKKEGHVSKGIQIIEEKLKLLSQDLDLPKPVIIEDLSERTGDLNGTEVIISLPPPLYMTIGQTT